MDLVVYNSLAELEWVQDKMTGLTFPPVHVPFWIGLQDYMTEGEWRWLDGRPLGAGFSHPGFNQWCLNQPDNAGGDEDCAVDYFEAWLFSGHGCLNDYPCGPYESVKAYACEQGVTCVPQCTAGDCGGTDGCGGTCGCGADEECVSGTCRCKHACSSGEVCGPNACGYDCGSCPEPLTCSQGQCLCIGNCAGRNCGSDGCGGFCGEQPAGLCNLENKEKCWDGVCGRCAPTMDWNAALGICQCKPGYVFSKDGTKCLELGAGTSCNGVDAKGYCTPDGSTWVHCADYPNACTGAKSPGLAYMPCPEFGSTCQTFAGNTGCRCHHPGRRMCWDCSSGHCIGSQGSSSQLLAICDGSFLELVDCFNGICGATVKGCMTVMYPNSAAGLIRCQCSATQYFEDTTGRCEDFPS